MGVGFYDELVAKAQEIVISPMLMIIIVLHTYIRVVILRDNDHYP